MFTTLYLKNTVLRADVISKLTSFYRALANNSKSKAPAFCKSYHSPPNRAFKTRSTRDSADQSNSDVFQVNTNVQNNVILFKSTSTVATTLLRCLTFGWSVGAMTLAVYATDVKTLPSWLNGVSWTEFKQTSRANFLYILNIIVGPVTALTSHLVIRRFVKSVILHKGGEYVTIVTNHLFKKERILTVPVKEVKINNTVKRNSYMPLKIRGKWFYFIMETEGKFYNQQLFNNTIGLAKAW